MGGAYLVWRIWFACLILGVRVLATTQSEATTRRTGLSTTSPSAPTCPSASINYITHTLAQQCLKTGYTAATTDRLNATSTATSGGPDASAPPRIIASSNTTSATVPESATITTNKTDTVLFTTTSSESFSSTTAQVPATATLEPVLEAVQADNENDSALDTAKFLSFEDWKNQNLAKAGQSAEHLGARANAAPGPERRRPENGNGLESFGEEAEIDIDFGFGGSPTTVPVSTAEHGPDASAAPSGNKVSAPLVRSRDAGRTCKERFNYASFDCAANIIKTNARSKSANSILVENKDSYMLNECSISNKFLIVELCDDILVDTIVLANFEFFSSMFRTFKISVSDRYPVKAEKWKDLGTFEAKNSRSIQAFLVENPLIWARYLRVEFLSHYGSEYYCPVSLIRIHGTTMMEEFRHQEQLARGELDDEDEEEVEEVEVMTRDTLPVQIVVPAVTDSYKPASTSDQASVEAAILSHTTAQLSSTASGSGTAPTDQTTFSTSSSTSDQPVESANLVEPEAVTITEKTTTTLYYKTTRSTESATSVTSSATSSETTSVSKNATTSSSTSENAANSTSSNIINQPAAVTDVSATTNHSSSSTPTTSSTVPVASTPPATQESFFKSIHKRLGSLESNATLSLQYIESQSALLRDAFASASKRQLARTTTFLDTLNSTISTELLRFKGEYDQLWQSTVLELAAQREEGRREREVLAEHVRLLAEEVVSQKRIVAVQAGLMLVCLGVVLLGQFGMGAIFGGSAFSPTYSKRGSMNGLGRQQEYTNISRANSPADLGNESGGSASAVGSAGKPPRHWRQRWRWDSPFRSGGNSGIASSAVSSAAKSRKPLPFERRVRSENDRTLLDARMQAMSAQEVDDDDDDSLARDENLLSPNSPATASVVDGTDGVSDIEVDGDTNERDRSISASRGSSAGSDIQPPATVMEEEEDSRTPVHDTGSSNENDRFPFGLLSVDENDGKELMQTKSAPTTPMV